MSATKSFMLSDVVPNAGTEDDHDGVGRRKNSRTRGDNLIARIGELLGDGDRFTLEDVGSVDGCSSCSSCSTGGCG